MAEINHDTVIEGSAHICVNSRLYQYPQLICSMCRTADDTLVVVRSNRLNEVLVNSEKQLWQAMREVLGIRYTKEKGTEHNAKVNQIRDAIFQRFHEIQLEPFTSGKLLEQAKEQLDAKKKE